MLFDPAVIESSETLNKSAYTLVLQEKKLFTTGAHMSQSKPFPNSGSHQAVQLRDISFEKAYFTELDLNTVEENIKALILETDRRIEALLEPSIKKPTDHNSVSAWLVDYEAAHQPLSKAATVLSHLNHVSNSEKLTESYEKILPLLSNHHTKWGHSESLYQQFLLLESLVLPDTVEQKLISDRLRDFKLSGIHLSSQDKAVFKQLSEQLSLLQNRFEQNLLESTKAWSLLVTDKTQLAGIPAQALEKAALSAKEHQQSGWRLTLDYPCYDAVMTHADNRSLRKTVHEAYISRASDITQYHDKAFDNSMLMVEILALRQQMARLLGFPNYAEYSLFDKMAKTSDTVFTFLEHLLEKSLPKAKEEFVTLNEFAKKSGHVGKLEPWDVAYYSEKLYDAEFTVSQEALRPYFPEKVVLSGLFEIVQRLFGLHFKVIQDKPTWDPSVQLLSVHKPDGTLYGYFYLDLYARPNKQGGAWVSDWVSRFESHGSTQYPIVFLQTNFTKPVVNKPSLLTHDEVVTLFHEFGHCLHYLITTVPYPSVAGGNGVPWDGIELPSQLLEYWAWQTETLPLISRHHETGESLPADLIANLKRAKLFQSGLHRIRQLQFGLFDMHLHTQVEPAVKTPEDIQALLDRVRVKTSLIPASPLNRFQHSFSHIFAGGYSAGYYSYQWAEVLASDAFASFQQKGILDPETGGKYRDTILSKGGSRDFMTLYEAFKGRKPSIDALLVEYGLQK
jgi:oligopeptidase A